MENEDRITIGEGVLLYHDDVVFMTKSDVKYLKLYKDEATKQKMAINLFLRTKEAEKFSAEYDKVGIPYPYLDTKEYMDYRNTPVMEAYLHYNEIYKMDVGRKRLTPLDIADQTKHFQKFRDFKEYYERKEKAKGYIRLVPDRKIIYNNTDKFRKPSPSLFSYLGVDGTYKEWRMFMCDCMVLSGLYSDEEINKRVKEIKKEDYKYVRRFCERVSLNGDYTPEKPYFLMYDLSDNKTRQEAINKYGIYDGLTIGEWITPEKYEAILKDDKRVKEVEATGDEFRFCMLHRIFDKDGNELGRTGAERYLQNLRIKEEKDREAHPWKLRYNRPSLLEQELFRNWTYCSASHALLIIGLIVGFFVNDGWLVWLVTIAIELIGVYEEDRIQAWVKSDWDLRNKKNDNGIGGRNL